MTSRSPVGARKPPYFFHLQPAAAPPITSGWLSTNDTYERDIGRRRRSYPSAITGADAAAATVADVAAAPNLSWAPPPPLATPPHAAAATAAARAECAARRRLSRPPAAPVPPPLHRFCIDRPETQHPGPAEGESPSPRPPTGRVALVAPSCRPRALETRAPRHRRRRCSPPSPPARRRVMRGGPSSGSPPRRRWRPPRRWRVAG